MTGHQVLNANNVLLQCSDEAVQTDCIKGHCTACGYNVRNNPLVAAGLISHELADILVGVPEAHKKTSVRSSVAKYARVMTSAEAIEGNLKKNKQYSISFRNLYHVYYL